MSLYDIQKQVDEWTKQFNPQYWHALEQLAQLAEETGEVQLAQLAEETGEVARELNYRYGTKKKKDAEKINNLSSELADVLFTICCIANSNNVSLEEAWNDMMKEKRYKRDNQRFERK